MWYHEKVFYQIYTLNFCGAPFDNDGHIVHRIQESTILWIILKN